jgi:hypothetical protein
MAAEQAKPVLSEMLPAALPDVENLGARVCRNRVATTKAPAVNLSFPPIGKQSAATPLTEDFAVLLVGIAARQAASPTAILSHQAETGKALLAPGHGAFNQTVADDLKRWKEASPRQPDE